MNSDEVDIQTLREHLNTLGEHAQPREDCPSPRQIWAAVHRQLEPKALREVIDHVSSCLVCAEAWDLAEATRPEASPNQSALLESFSRRAAWPWRQAVGIAASLLLLVVVVVQWPERTRSGGEEEIRIVDQGSTRDNFFIAWEGPETVTEYRVRLVWDQEAQAPLVQDFTKKPRCSVNRETLSLVPSGSILTWSIVSDRGTEELHHEVVLE